MFCAETLVSSRQLIIVKLAVFGKPEPVPHNFGGAGFST
jgi:hypothetical protein